LVAPAYSPARATTDDVAVDPSWRLIAAPDNRQRNATAGSRSECSQRM